MIKLFLLEAQILMVAHATAFCIMEWLYPGWRSHQKVKDADKKKAPAAPGMLVRFSEVVAGHTYKIRWVRTEAPFQETEKLLILSNTDGYVRFRRKSDNTVYVMDHGTAEQIAVVETETEDTTQC